MLWGSWPPLWACFWVHSESCPLRRVFLGKQLMRGQMLFQSLGVARKILQLVTFFLTVPNLWAWRILGKGTFWNVLIYPWNQIKVTPGSDCLATSLIKLSLPLYLVMEQLDYLVSKELILLSCKEFVCIGDNQNSNTCEPLISVAGEMLPAQ